jgi:hypothetical protein
MNQNELFSFSKRDVLMERSSITQFDINQQNQSLSNLQRMIKRMLLKCKKLEECIAE